MVSELPSSGAESAAKTILLTGLNFRDTEIELRERFAVHNGSLPTVLRQLLSCPVVQEACMVSTCNRTEIVIACPAGDTLAAKRHIHSVLASLTGLTAEAFTQHLYELEELQAVRHLFRVSAGLDSMILGEPQVLGQLKSAYHHAHTAGATGTLLNRLFHRTFGVAKAIRTRTGIGRNAVSICYAARELAEQIFGDLSQATVLLVGAGETGALAMKHFRSAGVHQMFIANKTLAKATELAASFGGAAIDLQGLPKLVPNCDIVVGASMLPAGAPPLVSYEMAEASLRKRRGAPQFFIDLGVPRNFDPSADQLADLFLYNVDDLQQVVNNNLDARTMELERAELIVEDELEKFARWRARQPVEAAIRELRVKHEQFCREEVAKTVRRLLRAGVPLEHREPMTRALQDLAEALLAKAFHQPMSVLKQKSAVEEHLSAFKEYFLDEIEEEPTEPVEKPVAIARRAGRR